MTNIQRAQRQFGRLSSRYASSPIHAAGESLQVLADFAAVRPGELAVDIGTGAGFTAAALAQSGARAVATDPTLPMLHRTRELARDRGLALALALAQGERLPLATASVDVVACRLACHHFEDLPTAIAEFRRVVKPGGRVVIADTVAPEDDALAVWMNDVELRRDSTHVRDWKPLEWRELLASHGFDIARDHMAKSPQEFGVWVHRAGTPSGAIPALRHDFENPPPGATEAWGLRNDGGTITWHWGNYVMLAVPR